MSPWPRQIIEASIVDMRARMRPGVGRRTSGGGLALVVGEEVVHVNDARVRMGSTEQQTRGDERERDEEWEEGSD